MSWRCPRCGRTPEVPADRHDHWCPRCDSLGVPLPASSALVETDPHQGDYLHASGVRVLGLETRLAYAHGEEPIAVVLARYRELVLAPFDALREDYEALGDARVSRHLDELLRAARGVDPELPLSSRRRADTLEDVNLTDEEREALLKATRPR